MSPFAIRGVIEGFYGNPWTQEQRLDHIQFIGRHGMNTFVYGPKDDPLVRRRWREPYDEAALARLGQVVAVASDAGIDVVYAISPGLSVRYSSAADLAVLLAKLDQVGSLGVTRFALLLDDLPPDLAHEEDRAAYPDLATAHAAFAGAVAAALGPERDLVVCPLVYHGRGDEPYLATLAAALAAFATAADEAGETGETDRLHAEATALRGLAETLLTAADQLLGGDVANAPLIEECRPWIEAFEVGARAMCRAADLAIEGRLPGDHDAVIAELLPYLAELRRRRVRVFGDALDMFLADTTVTHVRPGRLLPVEGGELR